MLLMEPLCAVIVPSSCDEKGAKEKGSKENIICPPAIGDKQISKTEC